MNSREIDREVRLRQAMRAAVDDIPESAALRLAAARRVAVSRKKMPVHLPAAVPAMAGFFGNGSQSWSHRVRRAGAALPVLIGIALFAGLYHFEEQQRINDAAEIDVAVLIDELPLSAYTDKGFYAYLVSDRD